MSKKKNKNKNKKKHQMATKTVQQQKSGNETGIFIEQKAKQNLASGKASPAVKEANKKEKKLAIIPPASVMEPTVQLAENSFKQKVAQIIKKASLGTAKKTEKDFDTYMDYQDYKSKYRSFKKRNRQIASGLCGIALLACVGFGIGGIVNLVEESGKAYSITVNDHPVVMVKKAELAETVVNEYLADQEKLVGQQVYISQRVDVVKTDKIEGTVVDKDQAKITLAAKVTPVVSGATILVNGNAVANLSDEQQAAKSLQGIKDLYVPVDNTLKVVDTKFKETVQICKNYVPVNKIYNKEEAKMILKGTEAKESYHYIAKSGDSLEKIAASEKVTPNHIAIYNPNIDFEKLTVGQKIKIKSEAPAVSVVTVLEKTKESSIPYKTVYKSDRSAPSGSNTVAEEGSDGKEEVSLKVVRVNGEETYRQRMNSTVLVAAVDKVVVKGSAPTSSSRSGSSSDSSSDGSTDNDNVSVADGGMTWPTSAHRISSYFGGRSRGYHTGLDIDGNHGDAVWAAKAGTVASAGWAGGYGYCVIISHGNGISTRYAHLSSISVKSGQSVSAGTGVGRVGSTGNSTGSHLHFEVIKGGSTVNPLPYIR